LAAGLSVVSGCGIIKVPPESWHVFRRQDQDDEQLNRLASAQSIEQIDAVFEEILACKNGQKTVERLLSGWGKHDSWYDLAVVHFIWKHWPSYYGRQENIDSGPLMSVIASRISEQPSLLAEYFWYAQWQVNGLSFKWLCQACES